MAVSIIINGLTLAHKGSDGFALATLPNVDNTPGPGQPVPVAYSNLAVSADLANGTKTVLVDGGNMAAHRASEISKSCGDEPGTLGGVKSGTSMKEATWLTYSPDVRLEGENACRLTDKLLMNHGNTACLAGWEQMNWEAKAKQDLDRLCKELKEKIEKAIGEGETAQPGQFDPVKQKWLYAPDKGLDERFRLMVSYGATERGWSGSSVVNKAGKNQYTVHKEEIEAKQRNLKKLNDLYEKYCKHRSKEDEEFLQRAQEWQSKAVPPSTYSPPSLVTELLGEEAKLLGDGGYELLDKLPLADLLHIGRSFFAGLGEWGAETLAG